MSPATRDDIEKTINAAVMDAGAAAAVMTGRLVRPLEATGFDAVDLTDAVGGSAPDGSPALPAPSRDDLAERRARKEAEKAVREAEQAASEAERALARVEARLGKARERADHLHERLDELRAEIARLEADASQAPMPRSTGSTRSVRTRHPSSVPRRRRPMRPAPPATRGTSHDADRGHRTRPRPALITQAHGRRSLA